MQLRNFVLGTIVGLSTAAAALAVAFYFPDWLDPVRDLLQVETADKNKLEEYKKKLEEANKPKEDPDIIAFSEEARANAKIKLEALSVATEPVWRTIVVPGIVVERPGHSERLVSAPLAGIVKQVFATPHDRVKPGEPLFTLQIVSEPLQTAQANLYKTSRDLALAEQRRMQLDDGFKSGAVSPATIIELEQQIQRLRASLDTHEFELKTRGLTKAQIDNVSKGTFLTEITICAPEPIAGRVTEQIHANGVPPQDQIANGDYELEELKTLVGDHVQAGQALCRLADHRTLFIEGRVFAGEASMVQEATKAGWPIEAKFADRTINNLQPQFFANKVDSDTQTLTFYAVLPNDFEEVNKAGKTYRQWRFRPGQRVMLHVPVEKFENVIVVPAEAVAREGAEAYLFKRKNAHDFQRVAVLVVYEDSRVVFLKNDEDDTLQIGVARPPRYAMNGAMQLLWKLKTQRAGGDADD